MNRNIEQLVNQILRAEKFSCPPIIAEKLAEFYFDLDFDWDNLGDVNVAAALSVEQKKIYMNELLKDKLVANVGFRNFTVAHELGHWVLHRNLTERHSQQIEREAELFAVHLLMPEDFVRTEFATLNSSRRLRLPVEMNIRTLANKFCVSFQAMRIRLSQSELSLIYVDENDKCYRSREEFLEKVCGQIRLF